MIPALLTETFVFIISFIVAPSVDIDGIREPISGSLLYRNNIIFGTIIPTSATTIFTSIPSGKQLLSMNGYTTGVFTS